MICWTPAPLHSHYWSVCMCGVEVGGALETVCSELCGWERRVFVVCGEVGFCQNMFNTRASHQNLIVALSKPFSHLSSNPQTALMPLHSIEQSFPLPIAGSVALKIDSGYSQCWVTVVPSLFPQTSQSLYSPPCDIYSMAHSAFSFVVMFSRPFSNRCCQSSALLAMALEKLTDVCVEQKLT